MRNFKYTFSFAFFLLFVSVAFVRAAAADDLRKGFEHPPEDARIMMRWWWFGPSVTKAEIERELRVMKEGGIGGVEVQPVYPLLPDDEAHGIKNLPYLSDEFLDMLKFAAEKSKELGMRFDLTLGSGWSFGGAKTPITEAAGQLRVERVKIDASTTRVPVPSMIPAEKLTGVFLPFTNPDSQAEPPWLELLVVHDGNIWLPADSGKVGTEVIFFISGKSGMQVKRPAFGAEGYVLNHLDKPSVDNYLKNTGDRLFQAFDKTTIPYSVFCDSLEVYNQDWTDDLLAEFQKRRGYDLKPLLPALVIDGPQSAEVRYDWGRTITEVFNDRFMIPVQAWAKKNGTKFRIQGYGLPPASISSNQWADISDGEGAQWRVVRAARWASSANHIYGRNVTSSETWTWLHSPVFRATPLDMKAEADIHFLQGINQLIGHGWAYTPRQVEYPGWRFYAAGIYTEKNPWWIVMPDLSIYLQRMSYVMRQGTPQNDVALYLPNADAYANFAPGKVHLIDMERELVGDKIMPAIFEAGYNLDFFDDEMLKTGSIDQQELVLGASRHRAIVLPGIERMPLESLHKLDAFVKSKGVVIATRRVPSILPGLSVTEADKAEFKEIAGRLFNGKNASVKFVEKDEDVGEALQRLTEPDARISPSAKDFGFVHRQTPDYDLYFVANTSNQKKNIRTEFRSFANRIEVWDPMNGATSSANISALGPDSTTVSLDFAPYESHVVAFLKREPKTVKKSSVRVAGSSIDLSRDWRVSVGQGTPVETAELKSWADDETTRYFSGVATYERSFDLPSNFQKAGGSVVLDFGEGTALDVQVSRNGMQTWFDPPIREAAVIYINGQRAGSLWCPPYRLDIAPFLKPGENEIKIRVGNTAMNYMAGRRLPDYKLLNLRYGERFQPQDMDKIQPIPSGLIGKIKLVSMF